MAHAQLNFIDCNESFSIKIVDVGEYESKDETISFTLYATGFGTLQRWFFCDSLTYKGLYRHNALILSGIRYEPKEGETAAEFMNRIRIPLHNAMMLDIIDNTI